MKNRLLTIITFIIIQISHQAFGQTQTEMNQEAQSRYLKSDKELNLVYDQILKEYNKDDEFITSLKIAQRIWVQFRDAETNSKFPARNSRIEYGSIYPLCLANYLTELTQYRTSKLKIWLIGAPEGDCCSGSVKMKANN